MTLRYILPAFAIIFSAQLTNNTVAYATPPSVEPNSLKPTPSGKIRINDAEAGTLMFHTAIAGQYIEAPMVATDVKMNIAGPVIRTTLSQTFENTSGEWVEGIYVFPLPENAAVDRLRMVIGGRMIEGQIEEKVQAKKIYTQAKAEGKKASLVEQQRPNIFTASVANIGPYEKVAIQIEYQGKADIKDGVFSTRFPMTVAPRYSPPAQVLKVSTTEGLQNIVVDPVLDRRAISPPLKRPADEPIEYMRLPVSLDINLDAGFHIGEIKSAYHQITTDTIDSDSAHIQLTAGKVPANRDFLLEWRAQETQTPYSSVFKQTIGEDTYLLSMLTPPQTEAVNISTRARESIFVIDTSGSMGGTSIVQARKSLLLALDHLRPGDTFNIIRFASDYSVFNGEPLPASPQNISRARRWIKRLQADGGTEMAPALEAALHNHSDNDERLRQVIFITDGAIGNEQQLFAQIQDQLGQSRLFPVGIGSAPNSFFMSRAAKFGRGTFVQIGDISEVSKRMGNLFKAIESPVLTNLQTSLNGASFPARLPDVYMGDPVVSVAKIKTGDLPDALSISGNLAGQTWTESKLLSRAEDVTGLSVLWARAKIADLEERRFDRDNATKIDSEILQTALDHHIVSRLTSLVAVDITPSRPIDDALNTARVPTMLPEGWDFAALAAQSAPKDSHIAPQKGLNPLSTRPPSLPLPNTASPHQILGLLGILLLLFSFGYNQLARRPHEIKA